MKSIIINSLIIIIALTSCRIFKQKSGFPKTIRIDYTEMYCGGAAPPDQLLSELSRIRPMANRTVEIYKINKDGLTPITLTTNDSGQFSLPKIKGKYAFLNVYPSVKGFEIDKDELLCYKDFIKKNLIKIDFNQPQNLIKILTFIQCNPCIPAAP